MSMLSNALSPSACETDVTGLVGMYAMIQASGKPSALVDWNNNYADDPDKCVLFHCSNFPQDLLGKKGRHAVRGDPRRHGGQGEDVRDHRGQDPPHGLHLLPRLHRRRRRAVSVPTWGKERSRRTPSRPSAGTAWRGSRGCRTSCGTSARAGTSTTSPSTPRASPAVVQEAFGKYLGWDVYNHDRARGAIVTGAVRVIRRGRNGKGHADHRDRLRHGLRARGGHRRPVRQRAGKRGRLVQALGSRESTATRRRTCSASTRGTTSKAWSPA